MSDDRICLVCERFASYGDMLYLDWGERGMVDVFLVTACAAPACIERVRAGVVAVFERRQRNARNAFVAGSIIHVEPVNRANPKGQRRVIIWSDCKDDRGWKSAWRVSENLQGRGQNALQYRPTFGVPRFVNRLDWRGWIARPAASLPEKYELVPLACVDDAQPLVQAFVRQWAKSLPEGWVPTIEHRLPPMVSTRPPTKGGARGIDDE